MFKRQKLSPSLSVLIGLTILWTVVQISRYFSYGIFITSDSYDYFKDAERILNGIFPELYLRMGYSLFVSFFLLSGLGTVGIVTAQLFLSLLAAFCIYRLAGKIYDRRAGVLAAFFYISFFKIHTFNFFILTESFFTSMIIISLSCLVSSKRAWQYLLSGLLVVFTCTVRPHGIVVLAAVVVFILCSLYEAGKYRSLLAVSGGAALAGIFLLVLVNQSSDFLMHSQRLPTGWISDRFWKVIEFKGKDTGLTDEKNLLINMIRFILDNPWYSFKYMAIKLWYFLTFIRPYFSSAHNLFVIFTLLPLYFLAVLGAFGKAKHSPAKMMLITVFCFQCIVAVITVVDPDGRHLLTFLPSVFVISAAGALRVPLVKKALQSFI